MRAVQAEIQPQALRPMRRRVLTTRVVDARVRARPGRADSSMARRTPGIRARWTFDCKYGAKMDAIALLQEWVQEVGAYADPALDETNTSMSTGNIGAPESRLELEVEFESLDDLERFWASIDPEKHMAWGEKVKAVMIDGTPQWEVYGGVDPFAGGGMTVPGQARQPRQSMNERQSNPRTRPAASSDVLEMASWDDMDRYAGKNWGSTFQDAKDLLGGESESDGGDSSLGTGQGQKRKGKPVLDWKGDPMVINPGDKLPFTFE